MQVNYVLSSKRFVTISKRFNDKWQPQEEGDTYLCSFNTEAWQSLPQAEYTLSECKECQERYADLSNVFPVGVRRGKTIVDKAPKTCPSISITEEDLSSPAALGGKVLKELTNISQQIFSQEILSEPPRSKLICKPTSKEEKKKQTEKK